MCGAPPLVNLFESYPHFSIFSFLKEFQSTPTQRLALSCRWDRQFPFFQESGVVPSIWGDHTDLIVSSVPRALSCLVFPSKTMLCWIGWLLRSKFPSMSREHEMDWPFSFTHSLFASSLLFTVVGPLCVCDKLGGRVLYSQDKIASCCSCSRSCSKNRDGSICL